MSSASYLYDISWLTFYKVCAVRMVVMASPRRQAFFQSWCLTHCGLADYGVALEADARKVAARMGKMVAGSVRSKSSSDTSCTGAPHPCRGREEERVAAAPGIWLRAASIQPSLWRYQWIITYAPSPLIIPSTVEHPWQTMGILVGVEVVNLIPRLCDEQDFPSTSCTNQIRDFSGSSSHHLLSPIKINEPSSRHRTFQALETGVQCNKP